MGNIKYIAHDCQFDIDIVNLRIQGRSLTISNITLLVTCFILTYYTENQWAIKYLLFLSHKYMLYGKKSKVKGNKLLKMLNCVQLNVLMCDIAKYQLEDILYVIFCQNTL